MYAIEQQTNSFLSSLLVVLVLSKKLLLSFVSLCNSLILHFKSLEFHFSLKFIWVDDFPDLFSLLFLKIYIMTCILRKWDIYTFLRPVRIWVFAVFLFNKFILIWLPVRKIIPLSFLFDFVFRFLATIKYFLFNIFKLSFMLVCYLFDKFFSVLEMFHSQNFGVFLNRFYFLSFLTFESLLYLFSFCFINFRFEFDLNIRKKVGLFKFVFFNHPLFFLEVYFCPELLIFQKLHQFLWSLRWDIMKSCYFVPTIVFAVRLGFFVDVFKLMSFDFFNIKFFIKVSELF